MSYFGEETNNTNISDECAMKRIVGYSTVLFIATTNWCFSFQGFRLIFCFLYRN